MKNKNIFILPTTDPSQVYLVKSTNALGLTSNNPESMEHYGSGTHNQHVYITNKDPYDRGDWCIDIEAQEIFKVAEVKEYSGIVRSDTDTYVYDACAKIVITSDPKLIADGIAGIDIEFLRLLKDKKLDEISTVEFEKTPLLSNNGRALFGYKYTPIILPKEEPKRDLEKEMFELEQELDIASNLRWHNSKPEQEPKKNIVILAGEDAIKEERERGITITHIGNQETLEEAYNRIYKSIDFTEFDFASFRLGVEWQKEQDLSMVQGYLSANLKNIELLKNSFSEADMREMYNKSCGQIGLGELNDQTENNNRFREFIEQIKNK